MANGVTTQWEDIHVKLGNYEARPKETPQSVLNEIGQEQILSTNPLEKKNQDELDEIDEDLMGDDDFFEEFKKKRLEEYKEQASKPHFGEVIEISKQDYIKQVNQAPPETFVILHLYETHVENCLLLNQYMSALAIKYPLVKFIKIQASRCLEKFPDSNLPTILIYKESKMVSNLQKVDRLFYKEFTQQNFERILHMHTVIQNEEFDEENEQLKISKKMLINPYKQNIQGEFKQDKLDDREYTNEQLKDWKKY